MEAFDGDDDSVGPVAENGKPPDVLKWKAQKMKAKDSGDQKSDGEKPDVEKIDVDKADVEKIDPVTGEKKKKEEEEAVARDDAEMDGEKVLVKDDGKKQHAAQDGLDNSVERTLSNMARTVIKAEEHIKTHARRFSKTLENEKLLKSVRLQQRIHRIKEVQMSRLRGKRLAKCK